MTKQSRYCISLNHVPAYRFILRHRNPPHYIQDDIYIFFLPKLTS